MKKAAYKVIKRAFDLAVSLIGLVVLSPLLLVLAILVRINLGSPVLFRQERPGLHEKIFALYKFRSMKDAQDKDGNPLPDELRLTRFGKILRASSLDELPELFNVLKGEMSLVGPRPPYITTNSAAGMTCFRESPAGHRSTGGTPSAGRKNSVWTCGMWTIGPRGWT